MSSIHLEGVSFAFPQQSYLITNCNLVLRDGWTGIVGANGAGKSTLLDLIDGSRVPEAGRVLRGPERISRVGQRFEPEALEAFANAWTNESGRLMSLLDLDAGDFWRLDELSPGVCKRWQIGAALFEQPGILILDEPTNHLDQAGRELLISALREFRGIGLVVSHDRDLLNRLTERTVRISDGVVSEYDAAYDKAREQWRAESARRLQELEAEQSRAATLQSQLASQSNRHSSAAHGLSTKSRMSSIRDSDARSIAAKGRAQRAESSHARSKANTKAELERVKSRLDGGWRPDSAGSSLQLDDTGCPHEVVLHFDDELRAGDVILYESMRFTLRRGERVWLRGANGAGKTTLMKACLAACSLPHERMLFVPQVFDEARLREQFDALDADQKTRCLQIGAALALDARPVLDGTALSPGQLRKLAISLGFMSTPWVTVLDEPTNDLDVESIERLEGALGDYEGALVVISHERRFAEELGAREVELSGLV